jgi:hypothetical protein
VDDLAKIMQESLFAYGEWHRCIFLAAGHLSDQPEHAMMMQCVAREVRHASSVNDRKTDCMKHEASLIGEMEEMWRLQLRKQHCSLERSPFDRNAARSEINVYSLHLKSGTRPMQVGKEFALLESKHICLSKGQM